MGCVTSKQHRKVEPIQAVGKGDDIGVIDHSPSVGDDVKKEKQERHDVPSTASSAHENAGLGTLPGSVCDKEVSPSTGLDASKIADTEKAEIAAKLDGKGGSLSVNAEGAGGNGVKEPASPMKETSPTIRATPAKEASPVKESAESPAPAKESPALSQDFEPPDRVDAPAVSSSASPSPKKEASEIHLHTITASDTADLEAKFTQYIARVDPILVKAVGLTEWQHLNDEMQRDSNREGAKEGPLQWMWISKTSEPCDASTADGLLVFRLLRLSFSNSAVISHFTQVEDWNKSFSDNLAELKRILFTGLAISAVRITLNYYDQGADTYAVHKGMEDILKALLFRWFQLSNSSDGRRGQMMQLKRGEEIPKPDSDDPQFLKPSRLAVCPVDEEKDEDEDD